MSCNGCRVLRKGCSESCLLRPCLQWMDSPDAQGFATVFVAKFFGRAGLMSFISSVSESHRPALFQSLLLEACGRTINPVNGAAGLMWTGRWDLCEAAVQTVLRGGNLNSIQEIAISDDSGLGFGGGDRTAKKQCDLNLWPGLISMNSDESVMTGGGGAGKNRLPRLLNLLL